MTPDVGNSCPHSSRCYVTAKLDDLVVLYRVTSINWMRSLRHSNYVSSHVTIHDRSLTCIEVTWDRCRDWRLDCRMRITGSKRDVPAQARNAFQHDRERKRQHDVYLVGSRSYPSGQSRRDWVVPRRVTQSSHTVCPCNQSVFGPLPSPGFIGFDIERIDLRGQCDSVRPEVRAVPRTTLFASGSQRRLERRLLSCYRCKTTT